jgi:hypothetical protein
VPDAEARAALRRLIAVLHAAAIAAAVPDAEALAALRKLIAALLAAAMMFGAFRGAHRLLSFLNGKRVLKFLVPGKRFLF